MENKKIPVYAKIDEEVKKRAIMYVTKCKLLGNPTKTMSELIEETLDDYMINHPI